MFFIILQARRMKHVQLNKCAWNNRITKGVGNPSMIQNQYITEKNPHTLVFDCSNYICLKWCSLCLDSYNVHGCINNILKTVLNLQHEKEEL